LAPRAAPPRTAAPAPPASTAVARNAGPTPTVARSNAVMMMAAVHSQAGAGHSAVSAASTTRR
jgi:hypothetical protein